MCRSPEIPVFLNSVFQCRLTISSELVLKSNCLNLTASYSAEGGYVHV